MSTFSGLRRTNSERWNKWTLNIGYCYLLYLFRVWYIGKNNIMWETSKLIFYCSSLICFKKIIFHFIKWRFCEGKLLEAGLITFKNKTVTIKNSELSTHYFSTSPRHQVRVVTELKRGQPSWVNIPISHPITGDGSAALLLTPLSPWRGVAEKMTSAPLCRYCNLVSFQSPDSELRSVFLTTNPA